MGWTKKQEDPVDGMSIPSGDPVPGPKDSKGYYTNAGFYVPTEQEFNERFPDMAEKNRDISNDKVRMMAWCHPHMRHLQPANTETATKMGKIGGKTTQELIATRKELRERKTLLLDAIKEELSDADRKRIKPRQILQTLMEDALVNGELDMAMDIATKLMPYDEPKQQAVTVTPLAPNVGNASDEDIQSFVDGTITEEEFQRRIKGE